MPDPRSREALLIRPFRHRRNMTPQHRLLSYYGYALESYCTSAVLPHSAEPRASGSSNSPPGWSGDVNNNVQWCQIVKTKIGNHRLILGGEVDCVRGRWRLPCDLCVVTTAEPIMRAQVFTTGLQTTLSSSRPLCQSKPRRTASNSRSMFAPYDTIACRWPYWLCIENC